MKPLNPILLVALIILGFTCTLRADTISFWHVYYNKTKIRDYNMFSESPVIHFRMDSIRANDSLTVRYFDDTPCRCMVTLMIQDDNGKNVVLKNVKGTGTPITFSLYNLIGDGRLNDQYYTVYFIEGDLTGSSPQIRLFTIHLE